MRPSSTPLSPCLVAVADGDGLLQLKAGEVLDGEGGFTVWGKQCPARVSLAEGYLPLGLAHGVKLKNSIAEGQALRWSDVAFDEAAQAVQVRREMEAMFAQVQ